MANIIFYLSFTLVYYLSIKSLTIAAINTMTNKKSHILIIEDDKILTSMVERGLREAGYQATSAYDLGEARKLIKDYTYDLLLLDINLPSGSGTQILAEMRRAQCQTPIIILSFLSDPRTKVLHLDVGADDFITKPFSFEELLARIAVQLRRYHKEYSDMLPDGASHELTAGSLVLNLRNQTATLNGDLIHFAPKEFDILAYLLHHQDIVCSHQSLTKAMGHKDGIPKTSTLNVHIMRVRKKLGDDYQIRCIKKRGFIFSAKQ